MDDLFTHQDLSLPESGKLDTMLRSAIKAALRPEHVATQLVEASLQKRGARFTPQSRARLRRAVETSLRRGTGDLDIPPSVTRLMVLSPEERANGRIRIDLDVDELQLRIRQQLPDLVTNTTTATARMLVAEITRNSRRGLDQNERARRGFEKRLKKRWGTALDTLDVLRAVARESGETAQRKYLRHDDLRASRVLAVLLRLHARACQIASEVAVLLQAGLADGAHARWRTLHEIAVVSLFVKDHGEDVADRYLLHQRVESRRAAHGYQDNAARLGLEPLTDAEMHDINEACDAVVAKYGKSFANDLGWAASTLGNPRPKFCDLEHAVDLDHMRPYYRMASSNVHANPHGAFYRLGLMNHRSVLLAGPSNAGLVEPADGAAISLTLTTMSLVLLRVDMDGLVACEILTLLRDRLARELSKAHETLVRDEAERASRKEPPRRGHRLPPRGPRRADE